MSSPTSPVVSVTVVKRPEMIYPGMEKYVRQMNKELDRQVSEVISIFVTEFNLEQEHVERLVYGVFGAVPKKQPKMKKEKVVKEKIPKEKVQKEKKEKKPKEKKLVLEAPFRATWGQSEGCMGLEFNGGLFTQCKGEALFDDLYCEKCYAENEEKGFLVCGTVKDRIEQGANFKDSKGRKAISYLKYLEKKKVTVETAQAYFEEQGVTIDPAIWEPEQVKVGGRPKKQKKGPSVEVEETEDLFAQLSLMEPISIPPVEEVDPVEEAKQEKKEQKEMGAADKESKKSELAAKKAEKEAELAAKKAEKEAELAAKKAEKEAELAAKKAEKEAELAAKKAAKEAEIVEKEAKRQAEKEAKEAARQAKEAELAAKKAAKEAELEAKKAAKGEKKTTKVEKEEKKSKKTEKTEKTTKVEVEEEPQPVKAVKAKRITIGTTTYYLTAENMLYDLETKEPVGIYDPKTQSVKSLPGDDAEEEEEEYEAEGPEVTEVELFGVKYLMDDNNIVYDPETEEPVGRYDDDSESIVPIK
jgi:hypothetical protein